VKSKSIKWSRAIFQPVLPIGDNRSLITGSKRHIAISHEAALEGSVLLKNENRTLPLKKGARAAMFGIAQADYVKVNELYTRQTEVEERLMELYEEAENFDEN